MTLKAILKQDAGEMYRITESLFDLVDENKLAWKPETGSNWMTTGQLVHHCTNACGMTVRGFLTGEWGMPDGTDLNELPPDTMLPPAESLPTVSSMTEARRLIAEDRRMTMELLDAADESVLLGDPFSPPWGGPPQTLFQHVSQMIVHLGQHKGQLFYYLKLQGKPVDTHTLYGVPVESPQA